MLFVSHDRYFINRIATKVLNVTSEGAAIFLGDYTYFTEKEEERAAHEAFEEREIDAALVESTSYEDNKQMRKERRKMERTRLKLEQDIEAQEALIADIEQTLTLPDIFNDSQKSYELHQKMVAAQEKLESAMDQWAELEAILEESE